MANRDIVIARPELGDPEVELVRQCLQSGWVTQGPMVREFERLVAARHQVAHAAACTSGTAALHLATLALGLGPGDEVIVPAFTWVTSAHCAEYVGAKAVFADVRADTFNLDPDAFAAAITPRTRAVVAVHLFGLTAEFDRIVPIAKKRGIAVIEDAACAIGTNFDGKPVGGWGDLGCFSFHPRKILTTGEGGMVTSNDSALARQVMCYRNHGASSHPASPADAAKPYTMGQFNVLGFNLRLSDILAAVGIAQMARLDHLLAERQVLAERYRALLADVEELALPYIPAKCGHSYQSFVVRVRGGGVSRRNAIMERLAEKRIQSRPGTHAVHRLGYYAEKYGIRPEQFPTAALCEDTSIALPLFPGMMEAEVQTVAATIKDALAEKKAAA